MTDCTEQTPLNNNNDPIDEKNDIRNRPRYSPASFLLVAISSLIFLYGLSGATHVESMRTSKLRSSTAVASDVMDESEDPSSSKPDSISGNYTFASLTQNIASLTESNHKKKKHKHKSAKDEDEDEIVSQLFFDNLYNPSMAAEKLYNPTEEEKKEMKETPLLGATLDRKPHNPPPEGCQATVVIIRHCEKGSIREHCNAIGFERAQYIATLFGNDEQSRWPAPSYLFATAPGQRKNEDVQNWREVETIQPLSNKISVPIETQYGMDNKKEFAKHIFHLLRDGNLCGKVALISWKHEDIPSLARNLGCGVEDGCPMTWDDQDFDSAWQLLYSYHKQLYPSFVSGEKKKHKVWGKHPEWWISGHVEKENFDPLEFSKNNGVYL